MSVTLAPPHQRTWLAAVVAWDLIALCHAVVHAAPPAAVGGPSAWLARTPAVPVAVAALGIVAAAQFARRAAMHLPGWLALAALATLSTAQGRLMGSPWRHLFFSGVALLGWLAGLAYSRTRRGVADESWARTGALALMGAAYFNAGLSKLVYGGADWLSGASLQAVVLGQDGLAHDGALWPWRVRVIDTPWLVSLLAIATTVFELAGPLLALEPRQAARPPHTATWWAPRTGVAVGLIAMHLTIFWMTEILYPESIVLLVTLALLARPALPEPDAPAGQHNRWLLPVLAGLAVAAVAGQGWRFWSPHDNRPTGPVAEVVAPLGPFAPGLTLAGWRLHTLESRRDGFSLFWRAGHGSPSTVRIDCSCGAQPAGPFDLGAAHIGYGGDQPFARVEPLATAVRQRILHEAASSTAGDVCSLWQRWLVRP